MAGVIPIVDVENAFEVGSAESTDAAGKIRSALEEVGFFYVTEHGIPWVIIDRTYDWARQFHELPIEAKVGLHINAAKVGYIPLGGGISAASQVANGSVRKPNLNEAFIVKSEAAGDNQWPVLPGFREDVTDYFARVRDLAFRMVGLIALSLDMPRSYFDEHFGDPYRGSLRMSHYPVVPHEEGQYGQDAHTDNGFITLLPNNRSAGLEIRPRGKDWTAAQQVEEGFLVNIGNTLARWTNDRYVATPHRVLNTSGHDRYALPFFYGPRPESVVVPLASCIGPGRPARYEPITFGELSQTFFDANYGHQLKK